MSQRKIIFIVIVSIILIGILFAFWKLSNSSKTKNNPVGGTLSVWIVGDTTDGYNSIISGFKEFAPEYNNMDIEFRKFSDYESYQNILLSTLADQKGPDIFMVEAGADSILEDKLEPIPSEYIHLSDFDKRYEDIFLPLLENSGSEDTLTTYLRGVPLGYETLGIFYNKSLLLTTPKTWNDVDRMYTDGSNPNVFPTNIGMRPGYTPVGTDIIGLFGIQNNVNTYENITGNNSIDQYISYALSTVTGENNGGEENSEIHTLQETESSLLEKKLTTLDLFMRGKIAFVVGYPSMIKDIEDAKKRAGIDAVDALILTEKIPQKSLNTNGINIGKYKYFGLSRTSKNPLVGAKFLDYLLTEDAERRFLEAFPLYIPAQRNFYESSKNTPLSQIFARTRLDSFIPVSGERVQLFEYGNKAEFEKILWSNIDRTGKIDKNNIKSQLDATIGCQQDEKKCAY